MHIETNGLSGDEEGRGPGKERRAVAGGQQDRPGLVLLSGHWLTLLGLFLVITAICTWFFVLPSAGARRESL